MYKTLIFFKRLYILISFVLQKPGKDFRELSFQKFGQLVANSTAKSRIENLGKKSRVANSELVVFFKFLAIAIVTTWRFSLRDTLFWSKTSKTSRKKAAFLIFKLCCQLKL